MAMTGVGFTVGGPGDHHWDFVYDTTYPTESLTYEQDGTRDFGVRASLVISG